MNVPRPLGRMFVLVLLLLAGLPGGAWAQQVAVVVRDGALPAGGAGLVEVGWTGLGAVELSAAGGKVDPRPGASAGRTWFLVPAAASGDTPVTLRAGGRSFSVALPTAAPPPARVGAPPVAEAAVGEPVTLRFTAPAEVPAGAFVVRSSEGRVESVTREGAELVVAVRPGPERNARVLAVAVGDQERPASPLAVGLVRLRARQTGTLDIGAGARATVRVGRRTYGPFAAGADGAAKVAFDVYPGETAAEIVATDELGNNQRISTPLSSSTAPVLVGVEGAAPDGESGRLALVALGPGGEPWAGAAPDCVSSPGALAPVGRVGAELRYAAPRAEGEPDLRFDCALGLASGRWRVPLGAGRPAHLELSVYPPTLSSDLPLANVQATLRDRQGERLDAGAVELRAARGRLQVSTVDGVRRGEYDGADAVEAGGDRLEARWSAPVGEGEVAELLVRAAASAGELRFGVRALDARGRPLPGAAVRARLGTEELAGQTGGDGWWRAGGPAPGVPVALTVEAGALRSGRVLLGDEAEALPGPGEPELAAAVELPIRAGVVRRIQLDVTPRPVRVGPGESALVSVVLLDTAGNPVKGELPTLGVDEGELGPPVARPDGTVESTWTPPLRTEARHATLSATVGDRQVATEVELLPRETLGAVGLSGGWITSFSYVHSPYLGLDATTRVPGLPGVYALRVSAGLYGVAADVEDDATGEPVSVRARFAPVEVGPELRFWSGRRVFDGGVGLVAVPYTLAVDYAGVPGVEALSLTPPGFVVHAGAGLRVGAAELHGEARYLFVPIPDSVVDFAGVSGGLVVAGGLRFLY